MQAVYEVVNTLNGHRYVGSSIDVSRRLRHHAVDLIRGVHHCQPLQRAWKKYGADVFTFRVIEEVCGSSAELLDAERLHIRATPADARYNCLFETGRSPGYSGHRDTPETLAKKSIAAKRRGLSEGFKATWQKGRKKSMATRIKMSLFQKSRHLKKRLEQTP